MIKKLFLYFVFSLVVFLPYTPLLAQDFGYKTFSEGAGYSTDTRDVYAIIDTVISTVLSVIAILLFALMMYGGMRWMTAEGNDDKVQKAKDIIQGGGIGLAIVLSAYGITYFIFNQLVK